MRGQRAEIRRDREAGAGCKPVGLVLGEQEPPLRLNFRGAKGRLALGRPRGPKKGNKGGEKRKQRASAEWGELMEPLGGFRGALSFS